METIKKRIAIVGGGPAGMFMFKRLLESGNQDLDITIFEKQSRLGAGMPYSELGSTDEHITNVSDNEIPELPESVEDWLKHAPEHLIHHYNISPEIFNAYKVLPRLLFGSYLENQFEGMIKQARAQKMKVNILLNTLVTDIADDPKQEEVTITTSKDVYQFDAAIICSGHKWPKMHEDTVPGWFDSPYPPSKLAMKANFPVAVRGASLTAVDAVRTLARANGSFTKKEDGMYAYHLNEDNPAFKIVMHSLHGFLPAVRFHLEDTHLSHGVELSDEEVFRMKEEQDGFIPLDFLFNRLFKEPLKKSDPEFYESIKEMNIETFVSHALSLREELDAFVLMKAEHAEAEKSIRRRESVYWKEMLGTLSYAMNYPAKHLSAEDMLRLKQSLMPLIALVIAYVPQSSVREFLALHDAGVLSLVSVDRSSKVVPLEEGARVHWCDENKQAQQRDFLVFVDAIGQKHFMFHELPFESLKENGTVSPAVLRFQSEAAGATEMENGNKQVVKDEAGNYWLKVPGININDYFQVLDKYGAANDRVYMMAVPYIGGLNPDYSGLDFCEKASAQVVKALMAADHLSA